MQSINDIFECVIVIRKIKDILQVSPVLSHMNFCNLSLIGIYNYFALLKANILQTEHFTCCVSARRTEKD